METAVNNQAFFNTLYANRKNCEDEALDYKASFHFCHKKERLELVKDIVSFANTRGGVILFGVSDREYEWNGLDEDSDDLDDVSIRDFLTQYVSELPVFSCGSYKDPQGNQYYMFVIEKSENLISFTQRGEYEKIKKGKTKPDKRAVFQAGDIYGRVGSSSRSVAQDDFFLSRRSKGTKVLTNFDSIEIPYSQYVERDSDQRKLVEALRNPNIVHVRVNGIGGIGKTSFVHHLCRGILEEKIRVDFPIDSLIWITGKMDYFDPSGDIVTFRNSALTYSEMLETIARVLCVPIDSMGLDDLTRVLKEKLSIYPSLIVFDNMETINDQRIIDFYRGLPQKCHVIFTSRSDLTVAYQRFDLNGFDEDQFRQYSINCIKEFRPDRVEDIFQELEPNLGPFRKVTGGSPILAKAVISRICAGFNAASTIEKLVKITESKDSERYYQKAMDFCFNETFIKLTSDAKRILYMMSLSGDETESYSLSDISEIAKCKEEIADKIMQELSACSFCSIQGSKYSCPLVIKVFVSKKLAYENTIDSSMEEIARNRLAWAQINMKSSRSKEAFYSKIGAFDAKRKRAAARVDDIKDRYSRDHDYTNALKEFDNVIRDVPKYAFLYYEKARFMRFNDIGITSTECDDSFKKAIALEPKNSFYISEYGFFLKTKKGNMKAATSLFELALKLDPDAPNINHGYADCLAKLHPPKNGNASVNPDMVLKHFGKGYIADPQDYYDNLKNCQNAHAHAKYLLGLKRYEDALAIVDTYLAACPGEAKLLSLKGQILNSIDPTRVSGTQVQRWKGGVLSGASDETIRKMLEMVEDQ